MNHSLFFKVIPLAETPVTLYFGSSPAVYLDLLHQVVDDKEGRS